MSAADTEIKGQGAALQAEFAYDATQRTLRVNYRVRNTGDVALAVFDRGDRHAVASGRQRAGAVGAPLWTAAGEGALELSHTAQPLPRPAPVSPPSPVALKLAPGARAAGSFEFALPDAQAPQRLRWCLGWRGSMRISSTGRSGTARSRCGALRSRWPKPSSGSTTT
ncbi:hypothetical protein J5226_00005 [Lysobacter sp. K5869]|uniref:hypothetical protein n=1 Tax=Lysobacter sp. K5869 TaxID=2820808 RepID=UPI001C06423C|nr:hypothetical protein [Lysobacter sp. K5869]QWP76837.1 hypothetical protein J5226_00005 [Lysobacter sp. K5869]